MYESALTIAPESWMPVNAVCRCRAAIRSAILTIPLAGVRSAALSARRFRRERGDDFLKARIAADLALYFVTLRREEIDWAGLTTFDPAKILAGLDLIIPLPKGKTAFLQESAHVTSVRKLLHLRALNSCYFPH
jgi:hypothetical protein